MPSASPSSRAGHPSTATAAAPAARLGVLSKRLFAAGMVCAAGIAVLQAAPAMAGSVIVVGPGTNLSTTMSGLHAGDTLKLKPGQYTGWVRPLTVNAGTPDARITITAQDPAHPPLIVGVVTLVNARYWTISHLRIQGKVLNPTMARRAPLELWGGANWQVVGNEITGAVQTQSFANVVIANSDGGSGTAPTGFRFTANCVHDAANLHLNADHNIYVSFHSTANSNGMIDHNLIFSHPNGAGIKLGDGGATAARGPWGVTVKFNTIGNGGRQILLHGNVRNNVIAGNLLAISRTHFNASTQTTAIYVHDVTGTGNSYVHNYAYASSMISYDPGNDLHNSGDNAVRPDALARNTFGCNGWQTGTAKSAAYGRYGTGIFPRW